MATYRALVRCLLGAGILILGCDSAVKCKNDAGEDVDWYILYKLPSKDNSLSYMYMDESTNGWTLSNYAIDSTSGALARTLKPLFDFHVLKRENEGYLLYSDQPPNGKSVADSYGHSKGVVMLNRETGVWLSHSTPKFPYRRSHDVYRSEDFWPSSGSQNAQMFLCVTYLYNEFKKIGLQLKYIHPYAFDYHLPKTFHLELRCLTEKGCYPKKAPWMNMMELTSEQGHRFLSFAKYSRFGEDLYSGLVVKAWDQHLYVKSWGKMRNPLPSNCTLPHHVYNVLEVKLPGQRPFHHTTDHAKWCVTIDNNWACVADMNREEKQMKRGGGAICMRNVIVGTAFYRMVSDYERCNGEHDHTRVRQSEL